MSYGEKVLVTTVKENYNYPNGCNKNKSLNFLLVPNILQIRGSKYEYFAI